MRKKVQKEQTLAEAIADSLWDEIAQIDVSDYVAATRADKGCRRCHGRGYEQWAASPLKAESQTVRRYCTTSRCAGGSLHDMLLRARIHRLSTKKEKK